MRLYYLICAKTGKTLFASSDFDDVTIIQALFVDNDQNCWISRKELK